MPRRSRAWWVVGALALAAAGIVAWNVARSPLTPYEQFHMLRLGLRAYLQEEPDYARVEQASAGAASAARVEATGREHPAPTWTDFRGPGRRGVYTETAVRADWPAEGLPLVWRRPCGAVCRRGWRWGCRFRVGRRGGRSWSDGPPSEKCR